VAAVETKQDKTSYILLFFCTQAKISSNYLTKLEAYWSGVESKSIRVLFNKDVNSFRQGPVWPNTACFSRVTSAGYTTFYASNVVSLFKLTAVNPRRILKLIIQISWR